MVQTAQKLEEQTLAPWFSKPMRGHVAQFYTDETKLGVCALEYIYSGLRRNEMCIVIATPGKLIALQKGLRRLGIDISNLLASGCYITYDAEELLSGLLYGREIDTQQLNVLTAMLSRHLVLSSRRSVRIFGEMAALLRRQKNLVAMLQLEQVFDELLRHYRFSLYCAYPILNQRSEYDEVHQKIQAAHDHMFYC
jgi:hypothetical protein